MELDKLITEISVGEQQRTEILKALYHGAEKNYSEIFKKADVALYKTKQDRALRFAFYNESDALPDPAK